MDLELECTARLIPIPTGSFIRGGFITEVSSSLFKRFYLTTLDYSGNVRIYDGTPSEFTEQAELAVRHAMRGVAYHESGQDEVNRLIEIAGKLDIHYSPYTRIWESCILEIPYVLLGHDDGILHLVTKDTASLCQPRPQIGHVLTIPCEKDELVLYTAAGQEHYQIGLFTQKGPDWFFSVRIGFDSAKKKWLLASVPHVVIYDEPITTYRDILSSAIQELSGQACTYLSSGKVTEQQVIPEWAPAESSSRRASLSSDDIVWPPGNPHPGVL